jgi:tetratricopeptide (TPR) repeat protein
MRPPPSACAVLLALASAACAAPAASFRCPARGGVPWRELATDHFVVRTDLPARDAAAIVGRLERLRAAVGAALFEGAPEAPGRIEVIAFRTAAEYAPFAPAGAAGYYLRDAGGPPRIVLAAGIAAWQRALLAHELTHHFLASVFHRQPRWLAEGLAVYMESLGEDAGTGAVEVGAPPPARLDRARTRPVPVRELLAWDGRPGARPDLDAYAGSWLLVHYLAHRRADAFADLQRRLAAGEDPGAAWRAALPDLDPGRAGALEALDEALAEYVRAPVEAHRRAVEVPVAVGYFERPVPTPEVHAIRLALWAHGPDKGRAALEAEVREALSEDPAHPIALQVRAALDGTDAAPLARASVAAHPDDARAWTFLGVALDGGAEAAEREAAYRRAAELAPSNPVALHNLASDLVAQGRSGEALPFARRAASLAPWSPPVLAGYAAALSDLGQCRDAIDVQRRALEALAERADKESREALARGLSGYERQCGRAEVGR